MPVAVPAHETRSVELLRAQLDVERELAARLRSATKDERQRLYREVYEELARHVPQQPASARRESRRGQLELELRLLEPFIAGRSSFLEVGSGDSALSVCMAERIERVYCVEPCAPTWSGLELPRNLIMIEDAALPLDLPPQSIGLAYSCHFIEHLHPEDAIEHAREMQRLLAPGGHYICVTPNRLWGPHDISRYFADVPLGLHLKEYDHAELADLLRSAGFQRVAILRGIGRAPARWPSLPYRVVAALLDLLAPAGRRRILQLCAPRAREPFRALEQVVLIGER